MADRSRHIAAFRFAAGTEYHTNKLLRRVIKLIKSTIIMTKPKIHLPNGTSVLLYNSPKQSVNTDMDDDALDYAIKYTSYDGQRKELMVSWERESNEIVIEDFHLQDRDAETFYF